MRSMKKTVKFQFILLLVILSALPASAYTRSEMIGAMRLMVNSMKSMQPMKLAEGITWESWTYDEDANLMEMKYLMSPEVFKTLEVQSKQELANNVATSMAALLGTQGNEATKLMMQAFNTINPKFRIIYKCTNGKQVTSEFYAAAIARKAESPSSSNDMWEQQIASLKKALPIKADEITEWVDAYIDDKSYTGHPSLVFVYEVDVDANTFEGMREAKSYMRDIQRNNIKNFGTVLKLLIDSGYNWKMLYRLKNNSKVDPILFMFSNTELKSLK